MPDGAQVKIHYGPHKGETFERKGDQWHSDSGEKHSLDEMAANVFGQPVTSTHPFGVDHTKKSLEDNMDLDKWLSKAEISDELPTGEPGFSEGVEVSQKKDGSKVAGVGKNGGGESDGGEGRVGSSRPGPSLAYPNEGVATGTTDKLSEDDADVNKQMTDHEKPIEKTAKSFYASRYIPEAANDFEAAHIDAQRVAQLRKSEDVSVYIPVQREAPAQLQKSEGGEVFTVGRGDPQGINVSYSDHLDRYIENEIQGPNADTFYPHGRPTIGALGNLQKSEPCEACGLQKSLALSACPSCGHGTAVQNAGVIGGGVLIKSDRPGPAIRRAVRGQAVMLPGGIIVVEE